MKDNQPRLQEALAALCGAQPPIDRRETVDRHAHGREEHRRVEVFAVAGGLDPDWQPLIACVGRVTRRSLCRDTRTGLWPQRREVAYYACQIPLNARACAAAVRSHWGIENRNHHVRDGALGEDASRIRHKAGVFACLRSFALNILRANRIANITQALYVNCLSLDGLLSYAVA